ncbi:MAG: OmpA family protein [Verrucomicrobia bacterium]|nr:OmpA family protein [Verrucomicrobiota bacterium]MCG2680274.1 OmpA family protein [Kiritimatiellia bacterium]MCG2818908.1 OmpA family protein [Actinomycetes bacterium]MBU4247402.1 OmpA family protein [Verrucomicrobiota bacterium]MBU4290501.1 OmpA family protein [Verrucomicrobiota bacterium]
MKNPHRLVGIVIMGAVMLGASGKLWSQSTPSTSTAEDLPPWYVSIGGGYIRYEGDEATKNGGFGLLRLGYDYTPRWTFRGEFSYFPELKANTVYNYETGVPVPRPGLHGDSTWAVGLAGDALFHFIATDDRRWDPYLVGGLGLLHYEKMREWRSQTDVPIRAGIGLAYHFTPEWAVNVDLMEQMTIDKLEFNFIPGAGVSWSPAGRKPARSAGLALVAPGDHAAESTQASAPPSPPPADLQMFKLDMNSAEGKWHEYFSELDAIAKIIQTYPDSEILIEGYLDQQPNISERDARKLTEKRAEAIRDYFVQNHHIAKKRITAVGYGFSRQKAPNDPVNGNPENQRMEIHIRAARTAP